MTQTASDKTDFVGLLMGVSEQLIATIEAENALLRDRKYNKTEELQKEKARLSFAYENQIKVLRQNPSVIKNLNAEQKQSFNNLAERFDRVASENLHLLQAARQVNLRVLEAIRDAAMEHVNSTRSYAAPGDLSALHNKGNKAALSVTLDQRL